ncbi:segregation and condensation protein A [Kangiella shandongensis]|uniref:segregation and condensation protein A n=1 Tax=Kangiella shandongensis TaxID=2763258 RepID=UPI002E284F62|nr:ScpA family protein [Kangiella shandongensis]
MTESTGESNQEKQEAVEQEHSDPDHVQEEMPFALVDGEQVEEFPQDLYIPPDALEVFLEAFEGPLDLLLYLIKRQNLDILNIPIAHITEQYMEYVELMKALQLELAAEYLVMAAMLAEIKSRVLLPRPEVEDEDEEDPRADLIRRLQEYEQFKQAAEDIDELPRMGRDVYSVNVKKPDMNIIKPEPEVDMKELLVALRDVLKRAEMFSSHQVKFEALSVRERMGKVLERISAKSFTDFAKLFDPQEGRAGVVVTFLAIMELTKESLLEIIQSDGYGPIHVRAKTSGSIEGEEDIDEALADIETTSDQA